MKSLGRAILIAGIFFGTQNWAFAFCGFYAGKADASLFNEASQVVVVRDGQRTVISMLNDYSGPLSEFALIVPTPTVLQKGQVRVAEKEVFERLDAYSSPRLAEYFDRDPCQMNFQWGEPMRMTRNFMQAPVAPAAAMAATDQARSKALGVTIEAQYTLEEYDIVSLSATQSDGLETWLHENGYKIPAGASAALKPYINQGMKFFVAKVNLEEQLKTGYTTLRPLQFAYNSEKFMLPLRLGMLNAPPDKAQDLIVYLLTRHGRVESSNYRTVKLPANVNLPYFIKPGFDNFYKEMFNNQARQESNRVVFTEYFWNMAWCDPCAASPLRPDELKRAGVFWLDGDADANFQALTAPGGTVVRRPMPGPSYGGGQPVELTRLHVRYTPRTFPEDLMFTQTQDQQNWQARYVIQEPYQGTPEQCDIRIAQTNCAEMCKPRVERILNTPEDASDPRAFYRDRDVGPLMRDCVSACIAAKNEAVASATRYYQSDLPKRIQQEKETLAQLTGWTLRDIDAMPDARLYLGNALTPKDHRVDQAWWDRLFAGSSVTR